MEEMSVVLQCVSCSSEWTEGITTDELGDYVGGSIGTKCPSCGKLQVAVVIEEF